MRVFYFTEQPYTQAWGERSKWGQKMVRVDIPNRECDPHVASDLYNRYLDEYMLADELGLNVMINEHHSTATCLAASANMMLAMLARQTKKARILALGVPLANRSDPLRVAEELSMVDVISRGRLEMGFVKGVPYEVPISNLTPVRMMDRFWEAHDFVLKAMTTQDGPYSWEGEYFNYRSVNIWPRPYQQPHPPVWITALTPTSAPPIAKKKHVIATVLGGYGTRDLFDTYRKAYQEAHGVLPGNDRFAYTALVGVGATEAEGRRLGQILMGYLKTGGTVSPQFQLPPGYFTPEVAAKMIKTPYSEFKLKTRDGGTVALKGSDLDGLIASAVVMCGTPDQVYRQIVDFDEAVGGLGNLVIMAQAADLSHEDTVKSITLFAKEVLPRLQERQRDNRK